MKFIPNCATYRIVENVATKLRHEQNVVKTIIKIGKVGWPSPVCRTPCQETNWQTFYWSYGTENHVHHVNFLMIGWHHMSLALGLGEERVARTRNRWIRTRTRWLGLGELYIDLSREFSNYEAVKKVSEFYDSKSWRKKELRSSFEVTIGSYEASECCDTFNFCWKLSWRKIKWVYT